MNNLIESNNICNDDNRSADNDIDSDLDNDNNRYTYLLSLLEKCQQLKNEYYLDFSKQSFVTPKNRRDLFKWYSSHFKHGSFHADVIALSMSLVDAVLSRYDMVNIHNFSIVAHTCLWISCKFVYDDSSFHLASQILEYCDEKVVTINELVECESIIFDISTNILGAPTIVHIAEEICKLLNADGTQIKGFILGV